MPNPDLPTLVLADATAWSHWLSQHASTSPGIWLTMAKKGTATPTSLTLSQALDLALCHGWINGQGRKSLDYPDTTIQRYTPRTAKSTWSQINVNHVARLEKEGRMQTRGWEEVSKAKADGRWEAAYGGVDSIAVPEDLMRAIEGVEGAREAWEGLGRGERYLICLRLVNVRTEKGRQRNIARTMEGLVGEQSGKERGNGTKRKDGEGDVEVVGEESEATSAPVRESRAERAQRRSKRLRKEDTAGS